MGVGTLDGSAGLGSQEIRSFEIEVTADSLFTADTQFNFTFDGFSAIPEPSSVILSLISIAGLGLMRRRS